MLRPTVLPNALTACFAHARSGALRLGLAAMAWGLAPVAHAAGLPAYLKLPPGFSVGSIAADEGYGEAVIPTASKEDKVLRGHHWTAYLTATGVPPETAGKQLWAKLKPALQQAGWTTAAEWDSNPFQATIRNSQGRDAWAYIKLFGTDDIRMELIEVGTAHLALKLVPPADKPETVKAESGPFPYLTPPPGSTLGSGSPDGGPMLVSIDGQSEAQVVADNSIVKEYQSPATLSNLEFLTSYREALLAAGWQVPYQTAGMSQTDSVMVAHYAKNGRDLWAYLHHQPGTLSIRVGDAGKVDAGAALRRDCKLILRGVFFDFDKATLKPESDGALSRARDALKANAALPFEVQGHTDAVGNDGYNQKLSESRAQSVVAWLAGHGIAASQLSAKGYGKTRPIDSNESDEGRARNRRVELDCRK